MGHKRGGSFCFAKHGENGLLDILWDGKLVVLVLGRFVSSAEVDWKKSIREVSYLEELHVQRSFGRSLAITNKGTVDAVHSSTAVHSHNCDVEGAIGNTMVSAMAVSRAVGLGKLN